MRALDPVKRSGEDDPTNDEDSQLINNRQNGRRGRGRNGVRPQGGGGARVDQGNRIDNRARGNASQLHEKYKTLARDAQMQGDRVLTEYYLQFQDHYFRVLSEGQRRFEEQRPRREDGSYAQPYQDEGDEGEDGGDEGYDEPRAMQPQPRRDDNRGNENRNDGRRDEGRYEGRRDEGRNNEPRYAQDRGGERPYNDRQNGERQGGERPPRFERQDRPERQPRQEGYAEPRRYEERRPDSRLAEPRMAEPRGEPRAPEQRFDAPRADPPRREPQPELGLDAPAEAPRPRRGRPPRVNPPVAANGEDGAHGDAAERFDMAVLPPSIAPVPAASADGEDAPRRRRVRRPRVEGGEGDAGGDVAA